MKWLDIQLKEKIYLVTLNRPDVRNAFNPEMIREITLAFKNVPVESRMVVLQGNGKVFCSGADLEWMKSMVDYTFEKNVADSVELHLMFETMRNCPLPIVAVVQGAAMGGALGLIACSDVVIAEESTQFCFSEVRLGLAPAVISSFVLQKANLGLIGPWMISGKIFGAQEGVRMGLVHEVVGTENLAAVQDRWMQVFLDAAPGAIRDTKVLLQELLQKDDQEQKQITTQLIANRRVSAEGQEGLKAFLEKRKPSWKEVR